LVSGFLGRAPPPRFFFRPGRRGGGGGRSGGGSIRRWRGGGGGPGVGWPAGALGPGGGGGTRGRGRADCPRTWVAPLGQLHNGRGGGPSGKPRRRPWALGNRWGPFFGGPTPPPGRAGDFPGFIGEREVSEDPPPPPRVPISPAGSGPCDKTVRASVTTGSNRHRAISVRGGLEGGLSRIQGAKGGERGGEVRGRGDGG